MWDLTIQLPWWTTKLVTDGKDIGQSIARPSHNKLKRRIYISAVGGSGELDRYGIMNESILEKESNIALMFDPHVCFTKYTTPNKIPSFNKHQSKASLKGGRPLVEGARGGEEKWTKGTPLV